MWLDRMFHVQGLRLPIAPHFVGPYRPPCLRFRMYLPLVLPTTLYTLSLSYYCAACSVRSLLNENLTPAHWYTIYLVHKHKIGSGWPNESPRSFVIQLAARPAVGDKKLRHTPVEKTILRCQACQSNGFENLSLYAATLVRDAY